MQTLLLMAMFLNTLCFGAEHENTHVREPVFSRLPPIEEAKELLYALEAEKVKIISDAYIFAETGIFGVMSPDGDLVFRKVQMKAPETSLCDCLCMVQ